MDVLLMKFDPSVEGTSTLDKYAKQIELLSFSHGVAMQITGDISNTERTSGKPNHQDFTITKYLDQASPTDHHPAPTAHQHQSNGVKE